tara:strand:- start:35457 stop:35666 length:210 start_codon:yes stop_codon:yes gene_type:complete
MANKEDRDDAAQMAELAADGQQGFIRELVAMLLHSKKWWLTPILIVLLLVGALVILGGTGAAPFIYTVF